MVDVCLRRAGPLRGLALHPRHTALEPHTDPHDGDLVRRFADDWLPYIRVVDLPPRFRELDARAAAVRDLNPDEYPTAALGALLSPCVRLPRN
jgi:hypothetical protein